MNNLTRFFTYFASVLFGVLMVDLFMNDYPVYLMVGLFSVWFFMLLRIGHLSESSKHPSHSAKP